MRTEYESDNYQWAYDSLQGVGRFIRKSDNALSLLDTGTDCQNLREQLTRLAKDHPGRNPDSFDTEGRKIFDSMAEEYIYRH
jgi:hypothetical protein